MINTILAATLAQTATIDVCVVSFFPCRGDQIDQSGSYVDLRAKTRALTIDAAKALEEGSRFRGYKTQNPPSLRYRVVGAVALADRIRSLATP
jgi:hypothetical protein